MIGPGSPNDINQQPEAEDALVGGGTGARLDNRAGGGVGGAKVGCGDALADLNRLPGPKLN